MIPIFAFPVVLVAAATILLFFWQAAVVSIWASPTHVRCREGPSFRCAHFTPPPPTHPQTQAYVYSGIFVACITAFVLVFGLALQRLHRRAEALRPSRLAAPPVVEYVEAAPVVLTRSPSRSPR
jgi:hypothetical protein